MSGSIFDVKDFGARGDYDFATNAGADDYPAFQRALDAIAALSKPADSRGAILWIPFGVYRLSHSLVISRQMIIQGVGGVGGNGGSTLKFDRDRDGIVVHHGNSSPDGGDGSFTIIRDLAIQSDNAFAIAQCPGRSRSEDAQAINEDDPLTADPIAHTGHPVVSGSGIVIFGHGVLIENCHVVGFHYDGIHIESIDDKKNANLWAVQNCRVLTNGRHGLYVAGENGNAGRAIGLDCSNNCGWGVYDRSFLGNTYLGCHVADNGHYANEVLALAIDRAGSNTLYVGTRDGGAFRSNDGARSWGAINRGLLDFECLPVVQALALDPANAGTLYAGTNSGRLMDATGPFNRAVFQSNDGGRTWEGVGADRNGLAAGDVRTLVYDVGSALYAGTNAGGVFKSTLVSRTAADPLARITWEDFNAGLANRSINGLAIQETSPATLYAATAGGVYKRGNADETWSATGLNTGSVLAIAVDPARPGVLYAGTAGQGLLKSADGGATWNAINTGLSVNGQLVNDVRSLAIDSATPATLFAGTNGAGIFKTTDGGQTWTAVNTGLPGDLTGLVVRAIEIVGMTVYAGTSQGIFKTTTGGQSWHESDTTAAGNAFYGGAYKTTNPVGTSVVVGCYAEAGQGYGSEFSPSTFVLGNDLGGGLSANSLAPLVDGQGLTRLPLRSPVIHTVRQIVRPPNDPAKGLVPTSLFLGSVEADDSLILVDASTGNVLVMLPRIAPPNTDLTGRQYTVKRSDADPANPDRGAVALRGSDAPIDDSPGGSDILLDGQSGVTVVAAGARWHVLGKV